MNKFFLILTFFLCQTLAAQHITEIKTQPDEYWWGGAVALGSRMPYVQPLEVYNLETQNNNNQVVPLLLSNKGRYVWSDYPFSYSVKEGNMIITSTYEKIAVQSAGTTLRDAYLAACNAHFKPSGVLPDTLFFTMPQYNTWIELMYNQNQEDILAYARGIIDNGFPPGVLMIDDNWQRYYGNFDFRAEKFPNPKGMIDELHRMGFKVMLWICPFVSADSPEYRELNAKKYLIRDSKSGTALLKWWNGYSACYDFTNPEASAHFIALLKNMQREYGVDGFKFDAGDNGFYTSKTLESYKKDAISVDHTEAWARIGLEFPVNEYRACWQMGGEALVQRLGDKHYSWNAVRSLIPEMIAAGLAGYAYTCPDMIGGGQFKSFLNLDPTKFDQQLIVRSAQVHALMPMMQFSVAPWRILNEENLKIVKEMAHLHKRMGAYILNCARESAQTGEPIVQHMEYAYPNEGFAACKDQFMLGNNYMIAPVVTNQNKRTVKLPKGRWRDDLGKMHKGGRTIEIEVPLNRLPYFEKVK
ncbi:glycoside hydrolase [Bacteroides sp. 214]|uniref:glycoside hydrolase family 31 protein n=1 Tax=Bacteroides sp. 214 TaxID=2302935 RepID=UPI0013D5B39F|nr:glycoside hydrolase family 31 protein [Bacteroides sp. 214]NDW11403.1 glycoside hydrolase [Bacteroides sp. 214]